MLGTFDIPELQVLSLVDKEIKGISTSIEGMDSEGYSINILGIEYPFYEEEFPQHVKAYENMLYMQGTADPQIKATSLTNNGSKSRLWDLLKKVLPF